MASSSSSSTQNAYYYIISRKDNNYITFSLVDKTLRMMKRDTRNEEIYAQKFVASPVPDAGDQRFRFYVLEIDSTGVVSEGQYFFDFELDVESAPLVSKGPRTGNSQVWHRLKHQKEKNVWYIVSSNDKYLKNNGHEEPITVSNFTRKDRKRKRFQWIFRATS